MRRIDSFYTAKPTLAELYAEDAQLFSGLSGKIPVEEDGVTFADFVALALVELGELQTIFSTAATLKSFLGTWGTIHAANWTKMQDALNSAYNPIHNYDRTEEESETVTTGSTTTSSSSSAESGVEDRQDYLAGFNSTGPSSNPTTRSATTPGRKVDGTGTDELTAEVGRSRDLHISGNIGVTTSQQMVEAELQLRDKFALYYMILDDFRHEICVEVW